MKLFFLYCFIFFFGVVHGQEIGDPGIRKAKELYEKGRKVSSKSKDSAYFYLRRSLRIFKDVKDWENCIANLQGIAYTSSFHYDIATLGETLTSIDSLLRNRLTYFDSIEKGESIRNYHLFQKINYHTKLKNYQEVRENTANLIKRIERIPDSLWSSRDARMLCATYEYQAGAYKHEGEYLKAEELYKKSLRTILKYINEDFALPTYRLLGDLYRKKGDYIKSNTYLRKKLDQEIAKGTSSKNRVVKSCFAIADNHIRLQNQDSSRYYLSIANQQLLDQDPLQFQYHEMLGKTYLSEDKNQEAIAEFDTAVTLMITDDSNLKNVDIARLYSLKAQGFDQASHYTGALQNYQIALSKLATDFEYQRLADNPKISTAQNKFEYLKILIKKAGVLDKAKDALGALQSSQIAIRIMDELLPTFENEEDKQFLIGTFYPVFEIGLSSALQLYKETKDAFYIDTAFFLSEKSKSTMLLEAVFNSRAYQFSNIPEILLEKERQLKASINYLRKKITNKKDGQQWEDRLLIAKADYRNLITELENQYPSYYNLKYNNEVIGVKDFQSNLEAGSLAISYFVGGRNTYLIAISNEGKEFIEMATSDILEKQILALYDKLMTSKSEIAVLQEISKQIYTKILQPVLAPGLYSNLIIIPDGILHYIPFGSLYDGNSYVLENYTVGYANSATLLIQLGNNTTKNKGFLGFAPSFSDKYVPLVNADIEVESITSFFDGEVYKGTEATSDIFKEKSPLSGILHLATHAVIDDQIAENSYLVFSPQSEEEKLNISDIYALPINASLVALSACETGIGSLKKGEGMISLSRAFFYAGASSLASTKWQINDRSTSDIMQNFYKGLADGERKDEALRLAKLDFLRKNYDNDYKHPYYWSGLVITGSTFAINQETPLWIWLSIPLLILIGTAFFWRKRKMIYRSL